MVLDYKEYEHYDKMQKEGEIVLGKKPTKVLLPYIGIEGQLRREGEAVLREEQPLEYKIENKKKPLSTFKKLGIAVLMGYSALMSYNNYKLDEQVTDLYMNNLHWKMEYNNLERKREYDRVIYTGKVGLGSPVTPEMTLGEYIQFVENFHP